MKKRKLLLKVLFGIAIMLMVLVIINFIPTWTLKAKGMHELEGNWINVYYETEDVATKDAFELADSKAEEIAKKLGFSEKQDVNIYIYNYQSTMKTKKYGFIGP